MMEELYLQCPAACAIILRYLDDESLSNFLKVNDKWIIRYYMNTHKMFMNGKAVHIGLEIWKGEKIIHGSLTLSN